MLSKIEVQILNYEYTKITLKLNVENFLSFDTKSFSITKTYNKFNSLQMHNACIPTY